MRLKHETRVSEKTSVLLVMGLEAIKKKIKIIKKSSSNCVSNTSYERFLFQF